MSYAAVSDMVQRYGEREIIALSTPAGMELDTIGVARVEQVLADASALIDSYLNRRYAVPLADPPASVTRACCEIARCDLANTGDAVPSDPVLSARKAAVSWLELLARGTITLDGAIPANVSTNFSRIRTRPPCMGNGGLW